MQKKSILYANDNLCYIPIIGKVKHPFPNQINSNVNNNIKANYDWLQTLDNMIARTWLFSK